MMGCTPPRLPRIRVRTRRAALVASLLSLAYAGSLNAQTIVYVDADAVGNTGGTSWDNAYTDLQSALSRAFFFDVDEIWVAEGTYYPDIGTNQTAGDRASTFRSVADTDMYGGFAGDETSCEERDWSAHPTILSGDLEHNDNDNVDVDEPTRADNSYNVVTLDTEIIFDGFVVTGGNANGPVTSQRRGAGIRDAGYVEMRNVIVADNSSMSSGAGMRLELFGVVKNVRFENNHSQSSGGGLYCWLCAGVVLNQVSFVRNSAPVGGGLYLQGGNTTMLKATLEANRASSNGGGIWINGGEHILTNVAFYGNSADFDGGAIYADKSLLAVTNAVFSGNAATNDGGAIWTFGDSVTGTNVTFANNSSGMDGGALYLWSGDHRITNSILWDNRASGNQDDILGRESTTSLSFSLINGSPDLPPGVVDGGGNILDAEPRLVDPLGIDGIAGTRDDSLQLSPGSPAIDSGDNGALPADSLDLDDDGDHTEPISADLDLKHRVFDAGRGPIVDMGAFEFGAATVGVEAYDGDPTLGRVFGVFPNPTTGRLNIVLGLDPRRSTVQVTLYDITGRRRGVLYRGRVDGNQIPVDISANPSGIYVLRVRGKRQSSSGRVILIK